MILIIDANVVISALIKDGKSRELITSSRILFYSPDTLLESINKYKEEIIKKSGLTKKEFVKLFRVILGRVAIIDKKKYELKIKQADEILGHIDIEDVNYIALALSIKNNGIWSDDMHFKKQDKIRVLSTKELIELLV